MLHAIAAVLRMEQWAKTQLLVSIYFLTILDHSVIIFDKFSHHSLKLSRFMPKVG